MYKDADIMKITNICLGQCTVYCILVNTIMYVYLIVVAMGYQYHIGIVAVPESLTPTVSMGMTSMSIMEGNTLWVLDEWDRVFLVNISGND